MRSKYMIEIDVQGWGEASSDGRWLNYDYLVACGDTLEELMDDASVSTSDQDGGEGWTVHIGDLPNAEYAMAEALIFEQYLDQKLPVGVMPVGGVE